ncbi:hypothetical protein P43SY_005624 [Pythium insidiosum]|uniref:Uncharacterized protein n=1 Tax=Pythium insidiosum TaxID=114742 RepID=A0AAD5Q2I3_PYTIN|nr:hypothetical protein P43SY_005624 [Pythium insidiosum]
MRLRPHNRRSDHVFRSTLCGGEAILDLARKPTLSVVDNTLGLDACRLRVHDTEKRLLSDRRLFTAMLIDCGDNTLVCMLYQGMDTVTRASVEEFVVKWHGPEHEKAVIDEIGRYAEHVARLPTIDPRTVRLLKEGV